MKFYFFLFDWKKRLDQSPLLLDVYCVRTEQKNATIQYYYCKVQYCTVECPRRTLLLPLLPPLPWFTKTLISNTFISYQDCTAFSKSRTTQKNASTSINLQKMSSLKIATSARKYPCFECGLSFFSWFLCVA